MIVANDIRPGMIVEMDNGLYTCTEFQHVKPGKGGAFVKAKFKNFHIGSVVDKTLRPEEKFHLVRISKRNVNFLYQSQDNYVFMDNDSYEQIEVSQDKIGTAAGFLKENNEVSLLAREDTGEVMGIELPTAVNLMITETDPGFKGNTVTGATKPATMETGIIIQVPLFVNVGEVIRVDTRTNAYIERA
ncbi:elongation factor P [Candidatus Desantisbacteria bacterium]|nr:elongation factor P [Candidatus Desantisbacteria bacterium]